jgi:hypothetical protein
MKPLKPGDVVVIEWKDIWPNLKSTMYKFHGEIGVIIYKNITDNYLVECENKDFYYWHPTSLTKIGTL